MNKSLSVFFIALLIIFCSLFLKETMVYAQSSADEIINIDKLEKHWWGYRRYISTGNIQKVSSNLDSLAAELSILGGLTTPISFLNPLAGVIVGSIFEISSSYCWLLSTYCMKLDKGRGLIIDFSKGIIFYIKAI